MVQYFVKEIDFDMSQSLRHLNGNSNIVCTYIKNEMSRFVRKPDFAYAKTKTQISFAVTAKLISAFVFATRIVQFLFYLNPKFQASSHLLWLYSPFCVGPGQKPRRPVFSQRGSNDRFGDKSNKMICEPSKHSNQL